MTDQYLMGLIEEIFYIWAEPLDLDDLSKIIFDYDKGQIKKALDCLIKEKNEKESGIFIRVYDGSYQFTSRKSHDKYFEKLISKTEKKLTSSTLETLSLIAYKQPITRVEIDKIRGVNSQSTIDSLLARGLIKEKGRLDKIGKPIIYGTTDLFLQYFDIGSLDDLPEIRIESKDED